MNLPTREEIQLHVDSWLDEHQPALIGTILVCDPLVGPGTYWHDGNPGPGESLLIQLLAHGSPLDDRDFDDLSSVLQDTYQRVGYVSVDVIPAE